MKMGGGGGGGTGLLDQVQLFYQQIFFNKKKTKIQTFSDISKILPGLKYKYNDLKGGHVR